MKMLILIFTVVPCFLYPDARMLHWGQKDVALIGSLEIESRQEESFKTKVIVLKVVDTISISESKETVGWKPVKNVSKVQLRISKNTKINCPIGTKDPVKDFEKYRKQKVRIIGTILGATYIYDFEPIVIQVTSVQFSPCVKGSLSK